MKLKSNCRTGWRRLAGMVVGLAVILGIGVSAAEADTISGNLTGAPFSWGSGFDNATNWKAVGWTMPADDYFLDDVTLALEFTGGGGEVAEVSIWSGVSGPETLLTVLDSPLQGGLGDFTFTPASSLTMLAGETYWARVTNIAAVPGSDFFVWLDKSPQILPTGLATHVGYLFNGSPSGVSNLFEATGTLVPEPGSLALLAFGAAALVKRRRRVQ